MSNRSQGVAAARNTAAEIERLLREAEPIVRSVVGRRLAGRMRADYEDACQMARVRVWKAAAGFDPGLSEWCQCCSRVAAYAAVDWMRENGFVARNAYKRGEAAPSFYSISRIPGHHDGDEGLSVPDTRPDENAENLERAESFDWLVARVPAKYREIVVRYFRDGLTVLEVAESCGEARAGRGYSETGAWNAIQLSIKRLYFDSAVRKRYHHVNRRFFDAKPVPLEAAS